MNENIPNPKVTVVDSIMGSGKTSAAIQMMKESPKEVHYLYITPYLDEVERIIKSCPNKKFKQPKNKAGTKIDSIQELINKGENIVSTHALFKKFNEETIELAYINNYVLIMDEVADVVDIYTDKITDGEENRYIAPEDVNTILEKYAEIDQSTGLLRWTDEGYPNNGVFSNIKRMCKLDSLTVYKNQLFLWLFPVTVFKAFKEVYILTYLFDSQIQKYYYDMFNIEYEKKSAKKGIGNYYQFTEYNKDLENSNKIEYNKLIKIVENTKMNEIGMFEYSLSANWYKKATAHTLQILKNNISNLFINIAKSKSEDNMWTTFKEYKSKIAGKGYTKGFVSINSRATNQYKNKTVIAYPVNRYINPNIKLFFKSKDIEVNEDEYALSEMLQFIWRSAIRENKEITIYIPSDRMRRLLRNWINYMCKDLE